ncbi:MAG: methyltransferase domain-containing protein [Candidatus Krumholzibacteriota bacterium]|nr:methyltransferase domain-containing protein [Candidatus Krumholzibacteriota bacterium]
MHRQSPHVPRHLAPGKSAEEDHVIIQRRYRLATALCPPQGDVLLDFGCGNGVQTMLFAPHFRRVIGLDISRSYLDELAARAAEAGYGDRVETVHFHGQSFPLETAGVDYAVSFEVLEHVEDEAGALAELARVIRPGGSLVMSVPNKWWVFETHGADLPLLRWNRVPFFSWLPKPIHDRYARARIYRRPEIMRKIEETGFRVTAARYITAPMDVITNARIRHFFQRTLFRNDTTRIPSMATAILVVAERT